MAAMPGYTPSAKKTVSLGSILPLPDKPPPRIHPKRLKKPSSLHLVDAQPLVRSKHSREPQILTGILSICRESKTFSFFDGRSRYVDPLKREVERGAIIGNTDHEWIRRPSRVIAFMEIFF